MKRLVNYIEEALDVTKVKALNVIYKAKNNPTVVEVAGNMSEDDVMIYLDDMCLEKMVSTDEEFKKSIGDNYKDITDAYFEYDKYTVDKTPGGTVDIKWDAKVGGNDSKELAYYKLDNLKYIIKFTEFNLQNTDEENIDSELEKIFGAYESNETNKYPIGIVLDKIEHE